VTLKAFAAIIFLFLFCVGVFGVGFTVGESLLASAALTVVVIVVTWWQDVWPF
jgi:hypothetical protein